MCHSQCLFDSQAVLHLLFLVIKKQAPHQRQLPKNQGAERMFWERRHRLVCLKHMESYSLDAAPLTEGVLNQSQRRHVVLCASCFENAEHIQKCFLLSAMLIRLTELLGENVLRNRLCMKGRHTQQSSKHMIFQGAGGFGAKSS